MADRRMKLQETQLPLDVAQHFYVLAFALQKFLCLKWFKFLLWNKALVYFYAEHVTFFLPPPEDEPQ